MHNPEWQQLRCRAVTLSGAMAFIANDIVKRANAAPEMEGATPYVVRDVELHSMDDKTGEFAALTLRGEEETIWVEARYFFEGSAATPYIVCREGPLKFEIGEQV